jgi:hypothetical protein
MNDRLLPKVQEQIRRYESDHRGERPLYVLMPDEDADRLMDEVRRDKGYDRETIVTEVDGMKIVKYPAAKPGQIQLTNELPETSS